jgi:hypothetical protein
MTDVTGARYQILVDGEPSTNRDIKAIAFQTAEYLNTKIRMPRSRCTIG